MKQGSKHRTRTFKNRPIKICMNCTSSQHKVLKKKYENCEIECSICCKKVMNNSCNLCQCCNHFVHNSCAKIDKKRHFNK